MCANSEQYETGEEKLFSLLARKKRGIWDQKKEEKQQLRLYHGKKLSREPAFLRFDAWKNVGANEECEGWRRYDGYS